MIYNQVQSFQINDYTNHYVEIKLLDTECCTAKVQPFRKRELSKSLYINGALSNEESIKG